MSEFDDNPDFDDATDDYPDEDDSEYPDEADMDQDEGDEFAETSPCPYCHKPLYEQAELCPHCGKYISQEDTRRRPFVWIIFGAIACLIVVIIWIL
jgi:predicted nucleic acid-binding Zn ribbon protein